MNKDKYIPKIGDVVILQKSEDNWASKEDCGDDKISMDAILEKTPIVIVTDVRKCRVSSEHYEISFDGDGKWHWSTSNNHFKSYNTAKISSKSHNKALIKLLKPIL